MIFKLEIWHVFVNFEIFLTKVGLLPLFGLDYFDMSGLVSPLIYMRDGCMIMIMSSDRGEKRDEDFFAYFLPSLLRICVKKDNYIFTTLMGL